MRGATAVYGNSNHCVLCIAVAVTVKKHVFHTQEVLWHLLYISHFLALIFSVQ